MRVCVCVCLDKRGRGEEGTDVQGLRVCQHAAIGGGGSPRPRGRHLVHEFVEAFRPAVRHEEVAQEAFRMTPQGPARVPRRSARRLQELLRNCIDRRAEDVVVNVEGITVRGPKAAGPHGVEALAAEIQQIGARHAPPFRRHGGVKLGAPARHG